MARTVQVTSIATSPYRNSEKLSALLLVVGRMLNHSGSAIRVFGCPYLPIMSCLVSRSPSPSPKKISAETDVSRKLMDGADPRDVDLRSQLVPRYQGVCGHLIPMHLDQEVHN
jgi:hypothetical protein